MDSLSYPASKAVSPGGIISSITVPFNNMWTLKFKAQPTNEFFVTFNQMFGGSSQLPTTAEHCFVV